MTTASVRGSGRARIERRVVRAAEAALADKHYVSAIDVLVGVGWLHQSRVAEWRQGRLPFLESGITANLNKISTAMRAFRTWAQRRGLHPSDTGYVARTRDRRPLQFSVSGDAAIEKSYRTHWVSPELSERKRQGLAERASRPPDLVVISPLGDWTCSRCAGTGDLAIMEDAGPHCLTCAGMDHLVFLPRGTTALTRRAKTASRLSAVVVRFSTPWLRTANQG